jgi:hypothetical protein
MFTVSALAGGCPGAPFHAPGYNDFLNEMYDIGYGYRYEYDCPSHQLITSQCWGEADTPHWLYIEDNDDLYIDTYCALLDTYANDPTGFASALAILDQWWEDLKADTMEQFLIDIKACCPTSNDDPPEDPE